MTEQQIKEEVLRYINDNLYNYAILIDGEWGSGKTFFIKNTLSKEIEKQEEGREKPRAIKYISLYGCKTINDVQENIAWSFAENARDKIRDKANWSSTGDTVSGNILLSSKKIGNAILKKFLPEASLYEITSDWLNLGAFIFIFDDLERCDCALNEVFGFLNELVEHENTKVIIVANEKELSGIAEPDYLELQYYLALDDRIKWPKSEQSALWGRRENSKEISFDEMERRRGLLFPDRDANAEYKKIREKLIGVTLRYEPNVSVIISEIITASDYGEEIKALLRERVGLFSATMDNYHHHNLRTFQFFLSKVSYLIERLAEISIDAEYKKKICDQIIRETFIQAVRLKANYKLEQENTIGLSHEQDSTSTLIKKYVEKGNFLFEDFEKDILKIQEQLKASVPNDDAYYLLYQQYYFHTQEWCEEQLGKLIKQIQNDRYPISFYGKIIIAVQRLLDLGFDEGYMQQIKDGMIANIAAKGEVNILDEELWMIEDNDFKEKVQVIIAEINNVITNHSVKARSVTMIEILKQDDWIDGLEHYINPDNTSFPRDVPVFSKADVSQWVERLHEADPEEIDDFRHWLVQAYPRNQCRKSYVQDADSIKAIRNQLERLEETDLIKKACIGWLVYQINQIIQCNEPDSIEEDIESKEEDDASKVNN